MRRTRWGKRLRDGLVHGAVYFAAVTKAHFDFGGVYVYIHPHGVDMQVDYPCGLALAVQHVFIGAAGSVGNDLVAHKTLVDVGKLPVGAAAVEVGQAAAPIYAHQAACGAGAVVYRHALRDKVCTEHVGNALVGIERAAPLLNEFAFVPHGKANSGVRQRLAAYRIKAVRQLGGIGF